MVKVAIVGIGRWGKNLVREFDKLCEIFMCYSRGNKNNIRWLNENYPHIRHTSDLDEVLQSDVDAVVIATPITSHYKFALESLNHGKHVFVEKPISSNTNEAKKLISVAEKKKLTLFVGHIFLYHPVLKKLKELTKDDPIKYAKFVWNKFGAFDEDIALNLLSHDISIALEFFGKPQKICKFHERGIFTNSDIISVGLEFGQTRSCVIDISRVANSKSKSITILTGKNLFLWEDNLLYRLNKEKNTFELIFKSEIQPLAVECSEFLNSIKLNKKPRTDGMLGLDVVNLLSKLKK